MVKVTVVGNCSAGKTTMTHKMVYNKIPSEPLLTTIGADFHIMRGRTSVHIWDTGNLERFGAISARFYAQTRVFMIVYDNHDAVSACAALAKWHSQLSSKCDTFKDAIVYAVRAKADLIGKTAPDLVQLYCQQHSMHHISVSSIKNWNIDVLREKLFDVDSSASSSDSTVLLVPQRKSASERAWTCPRCIS